MFAPPSRGALVLTCACVWLQELYQKLTDYDIRFYMYELLKVRGPARLLRASPGVSTALTLVLFCVSCACARLWTTVTAWESCTATSNPTM